MIYQSQRWTNRYKQPRNKKRNHPFFISQTKNTILVCIMITLASLLFFIPIIYFVHQNYNVFRDLAFDLQPQLVRHLEREVLWLEAFMALSLIVLSAVTYVFISKITQKMMRTLVEMEEHMRQLLIGKWSIPHFESETDEDIKELSVTYDYLYRSLKVNTENELRILEKINVDPNNREAHAAWKNLIESKKQRLGIIQKQSGSNVVAIKPKSSEKSLDQKKVS